MAQVRGRLRDIDIATGSCVVALGDGSTVRARFSRQVEAAVVAAQNLDVIVSGAVVARTTDGRVSELCLDAIELLDVGWEDSRATVSPPARTAEELLALLNDAGAIGICSDRTDIGDSSEFAARLRRQAEAHRKT
jgi:hypothetical protein